MCQTSNGNKMFDVLMKSKFVIIIFGFDTIIDIGIHLDVQHLFCRVAFPRPTIYNEKGFYNLTNYVKNKLPINLQMKENYLFTNHL